MAGDIDWYCQFVQYGDLYEHIRDALWTPVSSGEGLGEGPSALRRPGQGKTEPSRQERQQGEKQRLRMPMEYDSEVEKIFERDFPSVYRFIRQVNQDGWENQNLPCRCNARSPAW